MTSSTAIARTAAFLFLLGLGLRLLFWSAGPDGGLGWHVGFQGDAPVWQDLVLRLVTDRPDPELRLPWRAPGMLWLVGSLWDGGGKTFLVRFVMVLAGATVAPLFWLLVRRSIAEVAALWAGVFAAVSTNLLLLSSGVHAEGIYLAGALAVLLLHKALVGRRPGARTMHTVLLALALGAAHAGLALLRPEHLLTAIAMLVVMRIQGLSWRWLALAVVAAVLALTPWQLRASRLVEEFNATGAPGTLTLPWDDDARDEVLALPAFAHRHVLELVDRTIAHRGGERVTKADLEIVREAYGSWPGPLSTPLVALYGPFNFFLAWTPEAAGGYSRAALDRDPQLLGGAERYPAFVQRTLGRQKRFDLGYPPHLDKVNNGYGRGLAEIGDDPIGSAGRVLTKLWHATEGAVGGLGGAGLPIGLSGQRRPVDVVTATGWWANAFRVIVVLVAGLGLWRVRRERALWPLFALALTKVVTVALFFGYARQGAVIAPVVWLGVAVVLASPSRLARRSWLPWALAGALLAFDGARVAMGVTATMDGHPVAGREPFPPDDFSLRTIEFR